MSKGNIAFTGLVALLATAAPLYAGSATWNLNPSSGDWTTNANWVNNVLPDFNSCSWLVIPSGTTFSPKLDISRTIPNIAIVKGIKGAHDKVVYNHYNVGI